MKFEFIKGSCILCGEAMHIAQNGLCSRCQKTIHSFPYCGRCGSELMQNAQSCGNCLKQEPAWEQMVIIGRYLEPLSILIHRYKFHQQYWLDRTLARLLYLAIRQARRTHQLPFPEAVIPVPLAHFRQWQRGYNQADLLAHWLAKWLGVPNCNNWVQRIKHTHSQRGLTAVGRRKNIKNAFLINPKAQCHFQSVALVDDVITTGSTLAEVAKCLRKVGVKHIQVWGLARA